MLRKSIGNVDHAKVFGEVIVVHRSFVQHAIDVDDQMFWKSVSLEGYFLSIRYTALLLINIGTYAATKTYTQCMVRLRARSVPH